MKKIKLPFDLKGLGKYPVETKRGDKVRIICTDRKRSIYPIIALITSSNNDTKCESVESYTYEGKYDYEKNTDSDLVFISEEYEKGDILYSSSDNSKQHYIYFYDSPDTPRLVYGITENKSPCLVYGITENKWNFYSSSDFFYNEDIRPATTEERMLFITKLAEKGIYYNSDTKKINYKFTLKDWCLMRKSTCSLWTLCQFSHMDGESFVAVGGVTYDYCIPCTEEDKYLIGTCDDY